MRRQHALRAREQRRQEPVQRPNAAQLELGVERLDADADERRQRVRGESLRHLFRGGFGVAVFLGVGPRAVTVLEVDPVVLDRLVVQLVDDAAVQVVRRVAVQVREPERAGERAGVGRVLLQRAQRGRAHARGDVALEQVRAAIHGVNGLAVAALAGVGCGELTVRVGETRDDVARLLLGQCGRHRALPGSRAAECRRRPAPGKTEARRTWRVARARPRSARSGCVGA